MDRRLEHLLLPHGLPQQLRRELADVALFGQAAAVGLEFEQLLWWDVHHHPLTEIHQSGACCPMVPMNCPQCSSNDHRVPVTNGQMADQIVRKRVCKDCGHIWFTVEVIVPKYAVGWATGLQRKPVLRVPVEVTTGMVRMRASHVEELSWDVNKRDKLAA